MVGAADPRPEDVQATFCATLVDEWLALGVRNAVIAPGSRSTPMALALTDRHEMCVHVVHDERSAAFVALGLALDGDPALLLCTSGTAAANFYPAVVEGGLSEVPMIVLTADRPEELRGVGAPQTIDQIDLFGRHVVWSRDPGVPDHGERSLWRELAVDAWTHAGHGPVQVNLAFREPLLGAVGELPERSDTPVRRPMATTGGRRSDPVPDLSAARGLILVGGRHGVERNEVSALADRTGWPVIADPISGLRDLQGSISTADALLRNERFATDHLPDVIVRIGRPAASKVLAQWTKRATNEGAVLVQVGGPGVINPDDNVAAVVSIDELLEAVPDREPHVDWLESWTSADRLADQVILDVLGRFDELTEPGAARSRSVADTIPVDADLVVASSMPVRDLEWFGGRRARAHANRGANGIDGVLGTALGRALTGRTTFVLLGDLAFVHDSNALTALDRRDADLRIVVVDNDGGGIFSFLPQATALSDERFEQLFGTPLGVDIVALATSYGLEARTVQTVDELVEQLAHLGPWVCCVPTDRRHNVEVHNELHAAVSAALDAY